MKHVHTFESFLNESKKTWDLWDHLVFMYWNDGTGTIPKKRQEWIDGELDNPTNVLHKHIPNWDKLDRNAQFDALKKLTGSKDKEVSDYLATVIDGMNKIK